MELIEPKIELTEPKSEPVGPKLEVKQEPGTVKQEPGDPEDFMNAMASSSMMINNETLKIKVENLLLSNQGLQKNSTDQRFNSIDPKLVLNAADARKRDYRSVIMLLVIPIVENV